MRPLVIALLLAAAPAFAVDETVVAEVDLDALEQAAPIEYRRSAWLLLLPILCALVVAWNVDWRDARVKAELAEARARRAPKKRGA